MLNSQRIPNKQKTAKMILLFLLCPIVAVFYAIKKFRLKESRIVLILFGVLLGFAYNFTDLSTDGSRYAQWFSDYQNTSVTEFITDITNLGNEGVTDIYTTCTYFFLSFITDNPHFLFAFWAFVYFFFLIKILSLIMDYTYKNIIGNKRIYLFFIVGLAFILPINAINGVRMWTAFVIYFYSVLNIILLENKKFYFLALASCLVHFSFLFSIVFLIYYDIFKTRPIFIWGLLVISFVGSLNMLPMIMPYIEEMGESVGDKVQGYSNEDYIELRSNMRTQQVWYAAYRQQILQYFLAIVLIWSYFILRKNNQISRIVKNTYLFAVVMYSMFNFSASTAVSVRYFYFHAFSTLIFLIILISEINCKRNIKYIFYLGLIPLSLWIGVGQLNAIQSFDYIILFSNFITLPLTLYFL